MPDEKHCADARARVLAGPARDALAFEVGARTPQSVGASPSVYHHALCRKYRKYRKVRLLLALHAALGDLTKGEGG